MGSQDKRSQQGRPGWVSMEYKSLRALSTGQAPQKCSSSQRLLLFLGAPTCAALTGIFLYSPHQGPTSKEDCKAWAAADGAQSQSSRGGPFSLVNQMPLD